MPVAQRYLLVALVPDLAAEMTTFEGVWAGIITRPGVTAILDLAYVTRETLDQILLPAEEAAPRRKRRVAS